MKYLAATIFFFFLLLACSTETENKNNSTQKKNKPSIQSDMYSFQTFEDTELGWGYCIFKGNKKILNQPHIPAIQGNRGFKSQNDAKKVAKLVLEKIVSGNFPPTVSVEEIQQLGIDI